MVTTIHSTNEGDTVDGLRRVREIVILLDRSVRGALQRRGVMDAGNRAVGLLQGCHGAHAYNILHSALARNLALDVVAAFDWSDSRRPETQLKASVPALVHYLGVPGVIDRLIEFSRRWDGLSPDQHESDCKDALIRIESRYAACLSDTEFQDSLSELRQLRHARVAHNLYDAESPEPTYGQMSLILDYVADFAADGLLAVVGRGQDYKGTESNAAKSACDLWANAFGGIRLAEIEGYQSLQAGELKAQRRGLQSADCQIPSQ